MSVRAVPTLPLNEAETKLVAEREGIVHDTVRNHLLDPGTILLGLSGNRGRLVFAHELMIARGAMVKLASGIPVILTRKGWRAIAHEFRYRPRAFFDKAPEVRWNQAMMRTRFMETTVSDAGLYLPQLVPLSVIPNMGTVTTPAVMKWLNLSGDEPGYLHHHDPFWSGIDLPERVGDMAVGYDGHDKSSWPNDATREFATTTWFTAMIGAAWSFAASKEASLMVGEDTIKGDAATEWVMTRLAEWIDNPDGLYNGHGLTLNTRLAERRLVGIMENGQANGAASAVDQATWDLWTGMNYQAALTEGRKLT